MSLKRLFFEDATESATPKLETSPKPKATRQTNPRKRATLPPILDRSFRWFRGLHPALRWSAGGGSFLSAVAWLLIASLVTSGAVSGLTPETAQAAGVYTSSSTDTLGNSHLAANSVTASSTYNLSEDDSSEDVQQQLGVDPNWRNGIVRGSGALKLTQGTSSISGVTAKYTPTMTMEGWLTIPTQPAGFSRFFGGQSINTYSTGLNTNGTVGIATLRDSGGTYRSCGTVTGSLALPVGTTFHFAQVWVAGESTTAVSWFVNGALLGSCTVPAVLSTINVTENGIASTSSGGAFALSGTIDEVRFSDIARYTSTFTPQRRFTEDANTTGLWHFDETGQTVYDSSGNGYNGTLGATSSVEASDPTRVDGAQAINQGFKGCSPDDTNDASCSTGGRLGAGNLTLGSNSSTTDDKQYEVQMVDGRSALNFAGIATYDNAILVPSASSLNSGSGSFTVEMWVNPSTTIESDRLYSKGCVGAVTGGYFNIMRDSDGKLSGSIRDSLGNTDSSLLLASPGALPDNIWSHVAVVVNRASNNIYTYINGVSSGLVQGISSITGLIAENCEISIGVSRFSGAGRPMLGSIDEFHYRSGIGYSTNFTVPKRIAKTSSSLLLLHLDEGSGQVVYDASGNGNNGTVGTTSGVNANEPTWTTGITRTNPLEGDPLYYQYRDVGNAAWSTALPAPTTSTQLGSTGIYLKFNPAGQYSAYDRFLINSWAVEAPTTSSPQRGTRRSFPNRAHLVASTSGGLDIIDSSTNTLWMRLPYGTVKDSAAKNGRIYFTSPGTSAITMRFESDGFSAYNAAGNKVSTTKIAARASIAYGSDSGLALVASNPTVVSVQVLGTNPPKQYLAVAGGTAGRVTVIGNETASLSNPITTSEGTAYSYDRAASASTYTKVLLASDGTLYAGNSSAGGVDAWTSVQSDSASQTTADRTYTTASTPALRSNSVNSLSATVGTSTAQAGSSTLAIGHDLGVDTIDEHSTQASSGIRYYTREGSTGTSGYSQKQFGGGLSFDGSNDYASVPDNSTLRFADTTFTVEFWMKSATNGGSTFSYPVAKGVNGGGWGAQISGGGVIQFWLKDTINNQIQISTSTAVNDANWHHIAAIVTTSTTVSSGNTGRIYVDGIDRTTVVSLSGLPYQTNTQTLDFGRRNASNYFPGIVEEVRLSNIARYSANFTPSKVPFTTDANTVALYHFNERDGQTIYDSSANANNGTLGATSSVSTDDPLRVIPAISGASDKVTAVGLTKSGGTARGMSFDGGDQIQAPASSSLSSNTISAGFWIKAAPQSSVKALFRHDGQTTGSPGFYIFAATSSSGIQIRIDTSGGTNQGSCGVANSLNSQWNYVVYTVTGASVVGYLNGVQSCTYTIPLLGSGIANTAVPAELMVGLIGSAGPIRYYSTALSATDVANLYNAERTGRIFDGYAANLVGYWKIDERSGQVITDSSGSGNNGTFGTNSLVSSNDPTPTIDGPALSQPPTLWVATNGAGSDDGAVTSIGGPNDLQTVTYTTTNSNLPDLDVTSLSISGGGLAFIGTENGGWSTGTGGAPELTNGERKGALHITGQTRITGKSRVSK